MNVTCDSCQKDFPISLKEKRHRNGIVETYFVCPHCNQRYTTYFTDQAVRKKQKQIKRLWDDIRGCRNVQLAETLKAKIDRLTEENKKRMDELKEQFVSS